MKSYPRIFIVILAFVTVLLLIPQPASAVEPKLTISPEKVTFGQTVSILVEYYDMKAHLVEFTFYYGALEIEEADTWVNGSTTYTWTIKEHWSQDPTTGGEGGYSIRVWIDNKTLWGSVWVEKTWTQIGAENTQNTNRLIASNEALGKLIVAAEYGVVGIVIFIIIILVFWGQHTAAHKRRRKSWWDWIWNHLGRIRVFIPFFWGQADEEFHEIINARSEFNETLVGSPKEWNWKIGPNSICSRNKDMMLTIKKLWMRFQLVETYGTSKMSMAKKAVEDMVAAKLPKPKPIATDDARYPLLMNRKKEDSS